MRRLFFKTLSMLTTVVILVSVVAVAALAGTARLRAGKWALPNREDLSVLVKEVVTYEEPQPSKTIYLDREALQVMGAPDNAAKNQSSLVAPGQSFLVPRYKASNANWQRLLGCVQSKFAGYDVRITDQRPASGDYILVKVGGTPASIGMAGKPLGGIAPFNGFAVPNAIVFAFDQGGQMRTQNNCQTIAHEVGHVYGLDHSYQCKDIMSYQQCGPKHFVDEPMACGEHEARPCEDQSHSQNSADDLLRMLGARRPNAASLASRR